MSATNNAIHVQPSPAASVIVCTYRRDEPLRNTLEQLVTQNLGDYEIIVIDQQADHDQATEAYLHELTSKQLIRYVHTDETGLTKARNRGAREAKGPLLLFCDDDVVLGSNWAQSHVAAYRSDGVAAVAGQVLHKGDTPVDRPGMFQHCNPIDDFTQIYGANFSIRKSAFLEIGGADENLGVHSYTEDVILANRLVARGMKIRYEPSASVLHLQWPRGGCRISDESQPTAEWEKSYSKLYWLFLSRPKSMRRRLAMLWEAARHGPLRRNMALRIWKQPMAWYGFVKAIVKARRDARRQSNS